MPMGARACAGQKRNVLTVLRGSRQRLAGLVDLASLRQLLACFTGTTHGALHGGLQRCVDGLAHELVFG